MEKTILQLEQILEQYAPRLQHIGDADFTYKPSLQKWSKKEILGHLVDAAQTNIRRFVVAQYEDRSFIKYAQDYWVAAARYQSYDRADLAALWVLLNKHACIVLKNIPPEKTQCLCDTGELHTLEWLAADYNKHLLHHLHQVLDLDPIAYP